MPALTVPKGCIYDEIVFKVMYFNVWHAQGLQM